MIMAMMCVRIVRMFVRHPLVPVPVTMTRSRRHGFRMGMLMMDIVRVLMFVPNRDMRMVMLMPLGKVQPHAQHHQHASYNELCRDGFSQKRYCNQSACKGRYREISPRPCCAKFS